MKKLLYFSVILFAGCSYAQNHEYKVVNTYHIQSPGGWDYIAVNDGKLYVSHGTQVNILNENSGIQLVSFQIRQVFMELLLTMNWEGVIQATED